jgi:hypothetical protein
MGTSWASFFVPFYAPINRSLRTALLYRLIPVEMQGIIDGCGNPFYLDLAAAIQYSRQQKINRYGSLS